MRVFWGLVGLALCSFSPVHAKDVVIKKGNWTVTFVENAKQFNVGYRLGKAGMRTVLEGMVPEVTYETGAGKACTVTSVSFPDVAYAKKNVNDVFGSGVCHSFVFSGRADGVALEQNFYIYKGKDYILTDVRIKGDASLRSNYIAPVKVEGGSELFPASEANRMLCVPFDNDCFCRYRLEPLSGNEKVSFEVAALFAGESREGLVLGSVEHNRWKSAVKVKASENGVINALRLYSGASEKEKDGNPGTRDVLPHGKVKGPVVSSARMFIGYFADWRDGMDDFGRANALVQPGRDTWTKGTPFGWQSWGVMADKNSFGVDCAVADYFHETLNPGGFCNDKGINVISIDAWDNMSGEQRAELCRHCEANGQIPGTYLTPFCLWWNEDMLKTHKLEGQDVYTGWDCVIKVNGEPFKLDGAYCLDPTHPGTKARIEYDVRRIRKEGFRYVKVDFTTNGIVQADSYYNKDVTTAVEAYNEGFSHFVKEANDGEPLFIALSIAPIFPYQYGNSRRIACDTWGKIGHSEYSMNAVGGGFWTKQFYQYNDPDHIVLVGNDAEKETEGENRARITNAASSGMLLVSDNYDLNDQSGRGNAVLSRERAQKVLMNKDVNEMGNLGLSFRPVYGYKPYKGNAWDAENCFMLHTSDYLYVSVINYADDELKGTLPFADLGIKAKDFDEVKELWSGQGITTGNDALDYAVPAKDARIYRFHKK